MALGFFNPIFQQPGLADRVEEIRRVLQPETGSILNPIMDLRGDGNPGTPPARPVQGSLKEALERPDPLWEHNFDAFFDSEFGYWSKAYIEDVDIPFYQFDRLNHYRGGKNYYYPGDFDLSQISVKLYEDRFLTTTYHLHSWRLRMRNRDHTVNMERHYKRTLNVRILDDRRQQVGVALLKGCWPISASPLAFHSSSSERAIITAEFSVDDVEFEFTRYKLPSGDIEDHSYDEWHEPGKTVA